MIRMLECAVVLELTSSATSGYFADQLAPPVSSDKIVDRDRSINSHKTASILITLYFSTPIAVALCNISRERVYSCTK